MFLRAGHWSQETCCLIRAKVIFPIIPQLCDIERMREGGEHWQWGSDVPTYIGVLPRFVWKGSDVKVGENFVISRIPNIDSSHSGSVPPTASPATSATPTKTPQET